MKRILPFFICCLLIITALLFFGGHGASDHTSNSVPTCPGIWTTGQVEVYFDANALAMVEAVLAQAKISIDMEMYLIGGTYGNRILRLLDEKARRGVHVRLIHSSGRSLEWAAWLKKKLPKTFIVSDQDHLNRQPHYIPIADKLFSDELSKSNIERAEFPVHLFPADGWNPLRSPHDKIIVVDNETAIIGGMNLATAVAQNHDLLIKVTGPAVQAVVNVFAYDWKLATTGHAVFPNLGTEVDVQAPLNENPTRMQFLVTRPDCESQYESILAMIRNAERRIWIQMYVLTDTGIIDALVTAANRGVEVRILLDAMKYSLGLRLRGAPNLSFGRKFLSNGIPVHIFRSQPGRQMHQKSMLIDGDLVAVGATNYTRQSFRVNTESMFLIESRSVAGIFENRFLNDWHAASDPLNLKDLTSHRIYYLMARWVSRYL